jgi:hypothetical protein
MGHVVPPRLLQNMLSDTSKSIFKRRTKGFQVCIHTCKDTICLNDASKTILWRAEGSSCSRHIRNSGLHPNCNHECPGFSHLGRESHGNISKAPTEEQHQECIPKIRQLGWISDSEIAYLLTISEQKLDEVYSIPRATAAGDEAAGPSNIVPGVAFSDDTGDMHEASERAYARERSIVSSNSEVSQLPSHPIAHGSPDDQHTIPKTFHLLYIPDPSRDCELLSHAETDLAYTTRSMLKEGFTCLKSIVPRQVFAKRVPPTEAHDERYVKVRISEWVSHYPPTQFPRLIFYQLWIMYRLSHITRGGRHLFSVSYMSWERFKEVALSADDASTAQDPFAYDCIVGGIDYTINFR